MGYLLKTGSTGPEVKLLQQALYWLRYAVKVTGIFDPATLEAVKSFQTSEGLTADGIAGLQTVAALNKLIVYVADIYHSDTVDWANISPFIQGNIIKVTEGATYTDPMFKANFNAARKLGMPVGLYMFVDAAINSQLQTANYMHDLAAINIKPGVDKAINPKNYKLCRM